MTLLDTIEKEGLRTDLPKVDVGDTVKVFVKIVEGEKNRLQAYEGTIIAKRNGAIRETITVRRVTFGVGVERIFPLHSPIIDHIDVVKKGKTRRAKLYFLRERTGRAANLKSEIE